MSNAWTPTRGRLTPESAAALRQSRLESGQSATRLAARLGCSRATLYRLEAGDTVAVDLLQRVGKVFSLWANIKPVRHCDYCGSQHDSGFTTWCGDCEPAFEGACNGTT